jgi:putative Holliday junction resolvase
MKFLGIDYGTKRIGIATSDEEGRLAFPKEIVLNDSDSFEKLGEIIEEENIKELVIGESVDFSGKLNVLSARIEIFIEELKNKFKLPVHKQKEFLTSVEARRHQAFSGQARKAESGNQHSRLKQIKSGRIDASAAALILQRYLDRRSRQEGGKENINSKI